MVSLYGRSAEEQKRYDNTDRLISAAYNGLLWEVQQCIPISDVNGFESKALRVAIERGHVDCVKALIPHTDEVWVEHYALRAACKSHQVGMFELLVPHTDSMEVSRLMEWLLNNHHETTARGLLPYVQLDEVAQRMNRFATPSKGVGLLMILQAEAQHERIHAHVSDPTLISNSTSNKRKI